MKGSVRYIITRPCLSEGSVRLLKYLDSVFPTDGPVSLLDERGAEHQARVDRSAGRVYGLQDLYHRHNLGVNDVLLITPLAEGRFQVECVVKPISDRQATLARGRSSDAPQRVVVSESPYVREVRLERRPASGVRSVEAPATAPAAYSEAGHKGGAVQTPEQTPVAPAAPAVPETAKPASSRLPAGTPTTSRAGSPAASSMRETNSGTPVSATPTIADRRVPAAPRAAPSDSVAPFAPPTRVSGEASTEEMLQELAQRIGYRLERLTDGVVRLKAELGAQSYSVLVALDLAATARPEWRSEADYLTVVVGEAERPQGLPRLTREALGAILENARLAQLTPIELRGYWNAGSFDLESAASVAELVSAQLSQRGVFSFVLLSLAQQPAHSVVTTARLAERLGSGVNIAELKGVLETLASAPFSALSPLGNGQYYLRADVHDMLRGLGEYAEGLRVRLNAEARLPASLRS
ncbi:hypothetical protein [Deinococcus peraridilitoris]|uniref:Uncharacterized protein n=1 Tax=Deinococcus peraridilitoris (strain DSM 19664 / LMG 22246 / CIP 109416 / KR-200) TaxID=937777 RepID=L0A1Z9_DEIPD|nr:hypothetical protein [Deinococcus peraridilitoris]AFZ67871.1 hypothetical protein Deipe_2395 [Deinococcus peraridilitoris DSM 19664]